jgi:hypothetical protein
VAIIASLNGKVAGYPWSKGESRQRQQYWYRGYVIQSRFDGLPAAAIGVLLAADIVVATHSAADRATMSLPGLPYRSLAATGPP